MAWQVPATTNSNSTIVNLGITDSVVVGIDVVLTSGSTAISGTGSNHDIRVMGRLSAYIGVSVGTPAQSGNHVSVAQTGQIDASFVGVILGGTSGQLENKGLVRGGSYGVVVNGTSSGSGSTIINDGQIVGAEAAIIRNDSSSAEALTIINRGFIQGAIKPFSNVDAVDRIVNTGVIVGDIDLNGGNDIYDGSDGRLEGSVRGGHGNDALRGGIDSNAFYGEAGNDTLMGGGGADALDGGDDVDTASYSSAKAAVLASLSNPAGNTGDAAGDTYVSIENLTGSTFADKLYGDGAANVIKGGNGSDLIRGGAGQDALDGNAGQDTLEGNSGNDSLSGGSENDKLTGGAGADRLTGGAGADRFIFASLAESTSASSGRDTIIDFSRGQGDKIDLFDVDAKAGISGNQAFTFIGDDAFSKSKGELRFKQDGGNTYLQADVDGNGTSDFIIEFNVSRTFIASDFVL